MSPYMKWYFIPHEKNNFCTKWSEMDFYASKVVSHPTWGWHFTWQKNYYLQKMVWNRLLGRQSDMSPYLIWHPTWYEKLFLLGNGFYAGKVVCHPMTDDISSYMHIFYYSWKLQVLMFSVKLWVDLWSVRALSSWCQKNTANGSLLKVFLLESCKPKLKLLTLLSLENQTTIKPRHF